MCRRSVLPQRDKSRTRPKACVIVFVQAYKRPPSLQLGACGLPRACPEAERHERESNMPYKQLFFRAEALEKIIRGAAALADAVRVTLRPKSKCVLIGKKRGRPLVSNDGVT